MSDSSTMSFQQRSLVQQGYTDYSPQELTEMEWGLRFTPFVCALIALYGLVTQQPGVLFSVAALGMWAFFFPATHPMDMLYNYVVRPAFAAAKIPPNPMQRRLACLSAAMMNILAGSLFLLKLPTAAYLVGGCLLVLQAIVIATHFCALSWMYEGVTRMLGTWNRPLEPQVAQQLLTAGGDRYRCAESAGICGPASGLCHQHASGKSLRLSASTPCRHVAVALQERHAQQHGAAAVAQERLHRSLQSGWL